MRDNSIPTDLADIAVLQMVGDIGVVGISDHACEALGDIVFVDLPTVGSVFAKG